MPVCRLLLNVTALGVYWVRQIDYQQRERLTCKDQANLGYVTASEVAIKARITNMSNRLIREVYVLLGNPEHLTQ